MKTTNEMMPSTNSNHKQQSSDSTAAAGNSIGDSTTSTLAATAISGRESKISTVTAATTTAGSAINSTSSASSSSSSSSTSSNSSSTGSGGKQKKTVTFKNILETSDDKSAVKKFYNPDNRAPLISIMKKECLNRQHLYSRSSECIVRPSRLTEILKNNSNIDKLNSLKFRTNHTTSTMATNGDGISVGGTGGGGLASAVFGGTGLACAFGGPAVYANDHKHDTVAFRLSEAHKPIANGYTNDINPKREENSDSSEFGGSTAATKTVAHALEEEQTEAEVDDAENGKSRIEDVAEDDEEEQQIVVDKHFVLPKRSTRSSRVIKPNKWLLEDGFICRRVSHPKPKQTHTTATTAATSVSTVTSTTGPGVGATKKEQPNYFSIGDYAEAGKASSDSLGWFVT